MSALRFRSIFLSDVHLGTPDCKAAYLLDFLRRTRSEYLYLVGDIIDLEALGRRPYWHPLHSAILGELLHKAESGTKVIYIPGNHDAALRGLSGQKFGHIDIKLSDVHVGADGRRFRVSHGDEYDPEDFGKRWIHWVGEHGQRFICWANRNFNRLRKRFDLPYLPLSIIAKSRIGRALEYIRGYENAVSERAAVEGFDGHICGHIHYGGIRQINGVLYCNDGDWVEHCTALTENELGVLELLHWTEHQTTLAHASSELVLPTPAAALAFAALTPSRFAELRPAA